MRYMVIARIVRSMIIRKAIIARDVLSCLEVLHLYNKSGIMYLISIHLIITQLHQLSFENYLSECKAIKKNYPKYIPNDFKLYH
jgi:hypothetical protein